MDRCAHGMERDWCYLCRIDRSGADPRAAWGLDAWDADGGSSIVVESFLDEPMSDTQARTLFFLAQRAGAEPETNLTYGQARSKIRRLVAQRGLKSA